VKRSRLSEHRADRRRLFRERVGRRVERHRLVEDLVGKLSGVLDQPFREPRVLLDHPVGQVHK
jgi:hypothetical protein